MRGRASVAASVPLPLEVLICWRSHEQHQRLASKGAADDKTLDAIVRSAGRHGQ
jgi:hypothetical protein